MDHGKKATSLSTTRLSPLAKPFTLNRSTHHQPSSSSSLLSPQEPSVQSLGHCNDDPFSSLLDSFRNSNLGTKVETVPVETALPSVEASTQNKEKSHFEQYPSHGIRWSHFEVLKEPSGPTYSPSVTGLGYGVSCRKEQGVDFHESLFGEGNGVGGSADDGSMLQKASTQNREKSHFEQYPSQEFGKSGDFDGVRWSHIEILKEPSVPTYSPSVSGLGYGVSCRKEQGMNFHESLFGQGNDIGSSVDDGSMLQKGKNAVDGLNPCLEVSDCIFGKSTGTFWGKDVLSNSKGTMYAADESSSSLETSCKLAPLKLSSDMSPVKNTPQNQSSKNLGDSDCDEDSPCWKGTMAPCLTPSEMSGSVQFHHVEKATEKHNSLNPLAPQFFPGIGYIKDDFVSSNSSASVTTNLLPGEDLLMQTVVAESPVELNKGIEAQHSTNIYGRENLFNNILNDPECRSVDPVLNSHCMMTQSSSKADCRKVVTIVDVDGFVKGTKDPRVNGPKRGVFPANGHSPTSTSSSSQVGVVADLFDTVKGFSKSLIESPKPDVQIMISAMHALSELLVQTCVDGVDSYNEPDCDMTPKIINNLNVFSTKKIEQRIPTLDSTQADSSYFLDRSSELPEGSEVASKEILTAPHQFYVKNDNIGKKDSVSEVLNERRKISFASSSHQGAEKGNEFAQLQVIRRSLGKNLDFEKQVHPEASLFWNLWLDSEAERCYRKFKTFCYLMEAGMDVNSTNVAELLR